MSLGISKEIPTKTVIGSGYYSKTLMRSLSLKVIMTETRLENRSGNWMTMDLRMANWTRTHLESSMTMGLMMESWKMMRLESSTKRGSRSESWMVKLTESSRSLERVTVNWMNFLPLLV